MKDAALRDFAARYTAAWCSHDAARVASFFAENGSLTINGGAPSVGRAAITAAAQGFMTAFPDMVVKMDGIATERTHAVYRWTLTGTNTVDIYTPNKDYMAAWGRRNVELTVVQWGSYTRSAEILSKRTHYPHCAQMYTAINRMMSGSRTASTASR